jgi:hypothetical protein
LGHTHDKFVPSDVTVAIIALNTTFLMIFLPDKNTLEASPEMYFFVIPTTACRQIFSGGVKPESSIFSRLKNIRIPVFTVETTLKKPSKLNHPKHTKKAPDFLRGFYFLPEFSQQIIASELHHPKWLNDAFPLNSLGTGHHNHEPIEIHILKCHWIYVRVYQYLRNYPPKEGCVI